MNHVESADLYGIHHWRILWSSYRRLTWVGFETTTTDPVQALYLVVVSTLTLSYFYTATPILLFLQCKIALRPFSFVSRHVYLIKVFYT